MIAIALPGVVLLLYVGTVALSTIMGWEPDNDGEGM